jgi:hypothetical protein
MDKALLKYVYDRFGPPLSNPDVSYSVTGSGEAVYKYIVTAFNETGETDGTLVEVSNAPDNLSAVQYIKLNWKPVDRAKGYRVYGRAEGYFGLLTELDADQTEFVDYGVLVPDLSKKPPQVNQTGRLNWEKVVFLPGRFAQSAEMNELQSILNAKLKSIGDAVFDDGDVIRGCSLTVDKETGEAKITEGLVYIDGAVRYVKEGRLTLPTTGTVYVGINVVRSYVDENDDPVLRDPAQGYPGYATAGAIREIVDFEWVYSENKDSIDVVMWKVVNGVPTQIKPPSQMSDVERIMGRKLYDLHGNVLIYGFKVKVFKHDTRRDMVIFEIEQGKAYVGGWEIEKPQVKFEVSIAQDKSDPILEEVSVWQGYLYQPDMLPVADVSQVVMRVKVGETRYVPNIVDACNWYYDNVGVSIDSILGVWTDSSKATSYTFSNSDPGCASRATDVVLSGSGFALNPARFSPGQSYYIEYLKFVTATKGIRQRAYQEDEFVYQSGVSEYQLSKSDVIKSRRSPIVVVNVDTDQQYVEGVDYEVNLGRSPTTLGPAKIRWLVSLSDGTKFKVKYYYWDHVVEGDYVTVDSYVSDLSSYDYDDIEYPNVIDFRADGMKPESEKPTILVQYRAYLSKWGWLVLKEDGEFDFVYGASAINPARPKRPDSGLPLYVVYFPAASQDLLLSAEVSYMVKRDYDVNKIESRIERMEHDLGLTMAELQLLTKETLAPKKALLVDSFVDVSMMDTVRSTVNIDSTRGRCFVRKNLQVGSLSISSMSNVSMTLRYLTLPWREDVFDQQLVWTEDYAFEVNPFSVFMTYVYVEPHPANDYWVETRESIVVVETEDRGLVFGSGVDPNARYLMDWGGKVIDLMDLARRGIDFDVSWSIGARFTVQSIRITQDIGVVVKNVEIAPYLRQRVVLLWIKGCLPGQDNIKAKFDGKKVSLSVATQSDINSVGLVGVTPRGSTGSQPDTVRADSNGEVIAKFVIPPGVRAGRRLIEVYTDDGLVYGSVEYFGQGMIQNLERLVREIKERRITITPVPRPFDPIAQSFYVEKPVVLTSAWIWVYKVPPSGVDYGLEVGIRELTESGLPGSRVLGRGSVSKRQIMTMMGIRREDETVTTPRFDNAVKVQFDDPIYLSPGWYCLYVACPVNGYYVFTAKGRKKVLGNLANPSWNKIGQGLDRQAHDGVFFMSYNGVTWEVDMERDLMFRLNKAVFDTSKVGIVELGVSGVDYPIYEFQYGTAVIVPPGTVVDSEYNIGSGWTAFKMVDFEQERKQEGYDVVNVGAEANSLKVRLSLRTQDSDVAPFIIKDFGFVQVWRYDSSSDYYTNEVDVGQQFTYFKMWINERLNNGVVNYMVSFDGGENWYNLPLVASLSLSDSWVEKELGGSLSSITGGVLTNASKFIVRINLNVGETTKWLSPELSALRVLVY